MTNGSFPIDHRRGKGQDDREELDTSFTPTSMPFPHSLDRFCTPPSPLPLTHAPDASFCVSRPSFSYTAPRGPATDDGRLASHTRLATRRHVGHSTCGHLALYNALDLRLGRPAVAAARRRRTRDSDRPPPRPRQPRADRHS